jgi:hypothetical protein
MVGRRQPASRLGSANEDWSAARACLGLRRRTPGDDGSVGLGLDALAHLIKR